MSLKSTLKKITSTVKKSVKSVPVQTASVNKAVSKPKTSAPRVGVSSLSALSKSQSGGMTYAPNMSMPSSPSGLGASGVALSKSGQPILATGGVSKSITPNTTKLGGTGGGKSNNSKGNNTVNVSGANQPITSQLSLNRTAGASQSSPTGTNNVTTGLGAVTGGLTNVDNSLLKNVPDITFPEPTATEIPTIAPLPTVDSQIEDIRTKQQTDFQDYLDSLKAPPSQADAYKKAQRESDILNKQKNVNELTGKLNAIVAKGEANQLSLVGQGRGIPEAIIGGQQAQIGRETAIAALPVQAQLSAAQGDLDAAEQNLNTLFKIYSDDATSKYNYQKSITEAIYNFASSQDKVKLEELQKIKDREYNEKQADLNMKKSLAIEANKNGAPASITNAILNSTDFAGALSAAGKYGSDPLDRQIKQAQLNKLLTESDTTSSSAIPGTKPTGKPDFVSAGFANRAEEANKTLTNVEVKNKGLLTSVLVNLRETRPFIKPNKLKQYDQAQINFLKAVLRKESGAAITVEEEASYAPVYFAYPGDTADVILQKQRARIDALNSLIGASGTAYGGTFQEKPETYKKSSYNSVQPIDSYLDSVDSTLKSTTNLYSQAGYEL